MATLSIEPNPNLPISLAYEDEHLLVAAKPPRMVTSPGKGHEHDTLMNALFATHGPRLQNIGRERDFGLLHRLDRETSGLVIVALTKSAYDALRTQFETRTVRKFYWAIVRGLPDPPKGVIRKPIREREERAGAYSSRKTAAVSRGGGRHAGLGPAKPAITAFRVVSAPDGADQGGASPASVVECRPVTGRLHQIRVHMAMIGHPVLGDGDYADQAVAAASPRLALHAHRIAFAHPSDGRAIDVATPFPRDLKTVLRRLGVKAPTHLAPLVDADSPDPPRAAAE